MKKSQLKVLIKKIIKEAIQKEIFGLDFGFGKKPRQQDERQRWVVNLLTKRGFSYEGTQKTDDGTIVVKLSRPYGKGRHGGPRYAFVFPDGTINQDKLNVDKFLNVVGENSDVEPVIKQSPPVSPAQRKVVELLVRRGWNKGQHDEKGNIVLSKDAGRFGNNNAIISVDGKVNGKHLNDFLSVGESMSKPQDPRFNDGREEAPMGAVNIGEGQRPCDCGSGQESEWEYDGQGIPLVRACPACRKKKLARYRPEILKPYTQADVDEPIEPEDDRYEENISEETGTGAVAGYSTPYAFSRKKSGSKRALDVTTKMGYKKVKDISERVKK